MLGYISGFSLHTCIPRIDAPPLLLYDLDGRRCVPGNKVVAVSEAVLPEPTEALFCAGSFKDTITEKRIGETMRIALGDPIILSNCTLLDPHEYPPPEKARTDWNANDVWAFRWEQTSGLLWVLRTCVCDADEVQLW